MKNFLSPKFPKAIHAARPLKTVLAPIKKHHQFNLGATNTANEVETMRVGRSVYRQSNRLSVENMERQVTSGESGPSIFGLGIRRWAAGIAKNYSQLATFALAGDDASLITLLDTCETDEAAMDTVVNTAIGQNSLIDKISSLACSTTTASHALIRIAEQDNYALEKSLIIARTKNGVKFLRNVANKFSKAPFEYRAIIEIGKQLPVVRDLLKKYQAKPTATNVELTQLVAMAINRYLIFRSEPAISIVVNKTDIELSRTTEGVNRIYKYVFVRLPDSNEVELRLLDLNKDKDIEHKHAWLEGEQVISAGLIYTDFEDKRIRINTNTIGLKEFFDHKKGLEKTVQYLEELFRDTDVRIVN
jgi:hypothetical protein